MLIIPAIDIRGGKCVRLLQGDPDKETVYSESPIDVAMEFQDAGAQLIHVVDLDGAFEGRPVNYSIVSAIVRAISVPIEIGGGIRTVEAIRAYIDAGVGRIILGTALLQEESADIIDRFANVLVAGVDARNRMVATHGWKKTSSVRAIDVIRSLRERGVVRFIYTDIATDGMLSGPNINAILELLKEIPGMELVASGGIASMEDIQKLHEIPPPGPMGCITGKALYDGRINLREAIVRFKQD